MQKQIKNKATPTRQTRTITPERVQAGIRHAIQVKEIDEKVLALES